MALKTAVLELSCGNEAAAEIVIPTVIDEVIHTVLAQYTLCVRISSRIGVEFVHMTDNEQFGYEVGGYTYHCYVAAWGEPPGRYWLDAAEAARRLSILRAKYESIGIHDLGHRHSIRFDDDSVLVG